MQQKYFGNDALFLNVQTRRPMQSVMEVLLPRYQNSSVDEIRIASTARRFVLSLSDSGLFDRRRSLLSLRKWATIPTSRAQCSSAAMGNGLKPRPKMKHVGLEAGERKETGSRETQVVRKSCPGICNQIEKLVLFKSYREALELFEILEVEEDGFEIENSTFDALINACIGLRSIKGVKRLCQFMSRNGVELDLYMRNRVLLMHVRCGMIIDARRLFDEMPEKSSVSWNTIVAGLVDSGEFEEALRYFLLMWRDGEFAGPRTLATAIRACAGLGIIFPGRQAHSCAVKMGLNQDVFVACALIDMYSKCGSLEDAQFVFDELPDEEKKSTVAWNTIIAGYALHGHSEEALSLYYEMREAQVEMDHFTFSIVIRICARLASVAHAKQAHAGLVRRGYGLDVVANTTLVDFYSKWGRVEDARNVFDKMPRKNVVSWNALIAGYGHRGRGQEAVDLFEEMATSGRRTAGPNHVTFLAVLSACSRSSGLTQRGREIFASMAGTHKVKPRAMHYACMVELLGRDGLLSEAHGLICGAPFRPTANMWAALLTACRAHGDLELGRLAAEELYALGPEKLGNYILLLNMYNATGRLKEAAGVVQTMKRRGMRILPPCTWVEVRKRDHIFHTGDRTHGGAGSGKVHDRVDDLMAEIARHGYVPGERTLLPDVDECEEQVSAYHSEKLAVAFGAMSSPEGVALQIVQSHRVCNDCHSAIKLMALVTKREIVLRDGSRFHHFKGGTCSCGDYW